MYSKDDINYFNFLKTNHPDIYKRVTEIYDKLKSDIRKGCHDLLNIATLISGSYQLLELDEPYLTENPRWLQMGTDIDNISSALVSIGEYRYAGVIKPQSIDTYEYIWRLHETIASDCANCPDIIMSVPPDLPPVRIDPDKIAFVIRALINNIADEQSDASVTMSADYDVDNLYINIADNLKTFNPETKASLFELFNTGKQNHIGLSLATSYRILLAHNGELSYRQNNPCGSIFTLTLPFTLYSENISGSGI